MTHSGNPYAAEETARLARERAERRAALQAAVGRPHARSLRQTVGGGLRAIADRVDSQPRPTGNRARGQHHPTASMGRGFPR